MAASRVSLISRIGGTFLPLTSTGLPGLAPQNRHGALNHALDHARNGASAYTRQLSRFHFDQLCGHLVSVHSVARYMA